MLWQGSAQRSESISVPRGFGISRNPPPARTLKKNAIVNRNWEKEIPSAAAATTSQPIAPGGCATVLLMLMGAFRLIKPHKLVRPEAHTNIVTALLLHISPCADFQLRSME